MIRVLHIVGKMHRGGIETLVMDLYRHIDRSKVQFDFLLFTHEPGFYDNEILHLGGRLFYAKARRNNPVRNILDIKQILCNNDIDIIHDHLSSCSYITPLKIAKNCGVECRVAHSHNTSLGNSKIGNLIHILNRKKIGKFATDYFACSKAAGQWMFGDVFKEKGKVLLNGITSKKYAFNLETRNIVRNSLGFKQDFVIGYVGRFEAQKNMLFICQIFFELSKKYNNIRLLLVGEGSLHGEMNTFLTEKGLLDKVTYTGVVDNVENYLQAMDIFVLPSLFEGLGIVAVEAQACGLKTILSDKIPAEAAILEDTEFVSIDNVDKWVNAISCFIENPSERKNTLDQIRSAGYDIKVSASLLEKFYLNAMEIN